MRSRRIFWAAAVLAAGGIGARWMARQAKDFTRISEGELQEHELGQHKDLQVDYDDDGENHQSVLLSLIVDENGNVVSAEPQVGPREAFAAAAAEAKTWKYRPFEKDGKRVLAEIRESTQVYPLENNSQSARDFPQLTSLAGVVMKLRRGECFWTCPEYRIEIHGDGTAIYTGIGGSVEVTGEVRERLSSGQVAELVTAFRQTNYFSLQHAYVAREDEKPTYKTSFEANGMKKSVVDYVGHKVGMPEAVTELEATIDRVTGTAKWIKGDAETVPRLKKAGWDFSSSEATKTMANAVGDGNLEFVQDLLKAGVTTESKDLVLAVQAKGADPKLLAVLMQAGVAKYSWRMKTKALAEAASAGQLEMVQRLIEYGGNPKGEERGGDGSRTVLMAAASSYRPQVVQAILAGHPNVNAVDDKGRGALHYLCTSDYLSDDALKNQARIIHLLAKAGERVNAQDGEGNAALHCSQHAEAAEALLEEGAQVNLRNNHGDTPLMTNTSADVAKLLVAAGADVRAKNKEGKTALDFAEYLEGSHGAKTKYLLALLQADAGKP